MADTMKILVNLIMQNQQLLQQQLQQQQLTAAAGGRELQQQTTAAAGDRGLQQQLAAGAGGRVEESDGTREGRVVDSSASLVGETAAILESLSGEALQASPSRSYPGFRVAGQAPIEDFSRRDGQGGKCGTIKGFGSARESTGMFGFGPAVSGINSSANKPTIPAFNCKQE